MSRTNRVAILGRRPQRAAAAASCLPPGPGVIMIGDAGSGARSASEWTAMMGDLRRLEVDLTRFRPGTDPDEIPLAQYVTTSAVAQADVLLTDASPAPEVVRSALYHAMGTVILQPGPSPTWLNTFAPFVHILAPSPGMLRALSDAPADADPMAQAQALAERLRVSVVAPLSASSAVLARRDHPPVRAEVKIGHPLTVSAQDAEDHFLGVLAAQVALRTPLAEAVSTAVTRTASWAGGAPG